MISLQEFLYEGDDLGATYWEASTLFKVWSPVADHMKVLLYQDSMDEIGISYDMVKTEHGIWELRLFGDYKNMYYNYKVITRTGETVTPDPYTKGATVNGMKGMIVDFSSINPVGWENHRLPQPIQSTEAVIYEMHIRDFSSDSSSGIHHKGKYLGFTETGTKTETGEMTGIDHLKELGITHLHIMPVFDFSSTDECNENEYNWGYDPFLYNVPEGSYSSDPIDGTIRIKEFKQMIQTLHENNIRIVMDIVYNHTYRVDSSPFHILAPGFYYRINQDGVYGNGSGCGNEIATEKPMVRKFILDSLKFWMTEYKIDGFRFDLMALIDINTMQEIQTLLRSINPNVLLYGEPWTGGGSFLDYPMQFQKGKQRGKQIAIFNDEFRNAIKGDNDGWYTGFVNGGMGHEQNMKRGIVGSIYYNPELSGFAEEPVESVNYVSSHDNLTLYDKMVKCCPGQSDCDIEKRNRLALSIIMTSQGIPFLHGGSEFLRTKGGNPNSYNAGDAVNAIRWDNKNKYHETFEYIKGLIEIRKSLEILRLRKAEEIRKTVSFLETPPGVVAYVLNSSVGDNAFHVLIVHNANRDSFQIILPYQGEWKLLANGVKADVKGIKDTIINTEFVRIDGISTFIYQMNSI